MPEIRNGFDLMEHLRKKTGRQKQGFLKLSDFLSIKARDKGIPFSGRFELTPLCNFSCKMCYVHIDADQLKQAVLPVETWKALIHQAWEAGMVIATLTGGECLAYPGFEELYLYLHSLGCQVSVLTNGFLLDENRIRFFREHMPTMIQVTLYGHNDETYERVTGKPAFTTVVENYKRAVEAKLPVFISITPNRYIGEDLMETIRIANELCNNVSINSFFTPPRAETGRSGEKDADLDLYIRAYQYYNTLKGYENIEISDADLPACGGPSHGTEECGFRCGGGRSSFAINWKGTLTPCTDMACIRGYPLKDGFAEAWKKVNDAVKHWPRVPECEGCPYDGICNNCPAIMQQFAAPGKLAPCLCEKTRQLVRCGVRHIPDCD